MATSAKPEFIPWPPAGLWMWAASPHRKRRPPWLKCVAMRALTPNRVTHVIRSIFAPRRCAIGASCANTAPSSTTAAAASPCSRIVPCMASESGLRSGSWGVWSTTTMRAKMQPAGASVTATSARSGSSRAWAAAVADPGGTNGPRIGKTIIDCSGRKMLLKAVRSKRSATRRTASARTKCSVYVLPAKPNAAGLHVAHGAGERGQAGPAPDPADRGPSPAAIPGQQRSALRGRAR